MNVTNLSDLLCTDLYSFYKVNNHQSGMVIGNLSKRDYFITKVSEQNSHHLVFYYVNFLSVIKNLSDKLVFLWVNFFTRHLKFYTFS